jgi:hypothetical protein
LVGKYSTVGSEFDGMNYRTIARHMTRAGHKMNHATARNILHAALAKIASQVLANGTNSVMNAGELVRSPVFQAAVGAIVQDLYSGHE